MGGDWLVIRGEEVGVGAVGVLLQAQPSKHREESKLKQEGMLCFKIRGDLVFLSLHFSVLTVLRNTRVFLSKSNSTTTKNIMKENLG